MEGIRYIDNYAISVGTQEAGADPRLRFIFLL